MNLSIFTSSYTFVNEGEHHFDIPYKSIFRYSDVTTSGHFYLLFVLVFIFNVSQTRNESHQTQTTYLFFNLDVNLHQYKLQTSMLDFHLLTLIVIHYVLIIFDFVDLYTIVSEQYFLAMVLSRHISMIGACVQRAIFMFESSSLHVSNRAKISFEVFD